MTRPCRADVQAELKAANREHREVELTDEQLVELGHGKRPLTKIIRSFCLACQGDNAAEVRRPVARFGPIAWQRTPSRVARGDLASLNPLQESGFSPREARTGRGR